VWQHRFYDFVVFTDKNASNGYAHMHRNPVVRGLVLEPLQWRWRSSRHYAYDEPVAVLVNELQKAELHIREIS